MCSESLKVQLDREIDGYDLRLVKVNGLRDPRQEDTLSVKDTLAQASRHRERRPSHVLVRVVPLSNVVIHRNEADYCDATNIEADEASFIKRTVLTPLVDDCYLFCKFAFYFLRRKLIFFYFLFVEIKY